MGTAYISFDARDFYPKVSTPFIPDVLPGTNFTIPVAKFDLSDIGYLRTHLPAYSSGGTLAINWYADSDTGGNVEFSVSIAAITPNTDTQDIETKAFGTANVAEDAHLGTTNQRLHSLDVTLTNNDSWAAGDEVYIRVERTAASSDELTGYANVTTLQLSYTTA